MRILLICKAFYPNISPRSFRATELAKEFARQGHEVTVLFPKKSVDHEEFERIHSIKIKDLGVLRFREIKLIGSGPLLLLKRALRRTMLLLFEYPDIELMLKVAKALKSEKGYDLLISIAVPHPIHWGVAKAWNKSQSVAKKWIADCGDPYMFARLDTFKKLFYFKFYEKSFCRKCNYISVPFESMRMQFYPEFKGKIVIIPQGFNFDAIERYKGNISNPIPTFIFAGSIIPKFRDLTLFLDYLVEKNANFKFLVYTKQNSWFAEYKEKLNNKLILSEYIDRKSLIFEMSRVDFLVNVDTLFDTGNNIEAIPSKLIDYALADRPILNINTSSFSKELVDAFLSGDYSGARTIDLSRYDIKTVAKQFLDFL